VCTHGGQAVARSGGASLWFHSKFYATPTRLQPSG